MNGTMIALGITSILICMGMALRANIPFLRKMLVPTGVIAGILGFILINLLSKPLASIGIDEKTYSSIVDILFTISFISIGLSGSGKKKSKTNKETNAKNDGVGKGGLALGITWCILYTLTPLLGYFIIKIFGASFGMDGVYGMLIPFAFCQGPGQASSLGKIYESLYGYQNAEMVALTFAAVGFLVAFFIGVPLAKYGLKKGLAKNNAKLLLSVEKGYLDKSEQRESMGKVTTHTGNIETLTFHFALIGVCYVLALVISKLLSYIPVIGPSIGGMLFFCGMIAAYIVKVVMKKFKIDYLKNDALQGKITGFTSDFLVVCAFMAVKLTVIGSWIVPILIEGIIIALVTLVISIYLGQRIGSDHDFERVLGLYGTSTGTTPSGISLVRMVDPRLETSTAAELGMMNIAMLLSTPTSILMMMAAQKTIPMNITLIFMALLIVVYLIILKVFKLWGKPTFTLSKGKLDVSGEVIDGKENKLLQGFLRINDMDTTGLIE